MHPTPPLLTEAACTAKSHWGYPAEWMEMWRKDLTVTEEKIRKNEVVMALSGGQFIGFYMLINRDEKTWELDGFWVLPKFMGKGYGQQLFNHLMDFLRQQNADKLCVVSDPNANGFYEKMGGVKTGKFPSKPEGRVLDVFEIEVPQI